MVNPGWKAKDNSSGGHVLDGGHNIKQPSQKGRSYCKNFTSKKHCKVETTNFQFQVLPVGLPVVLRAPRQRTSGNPFVIFGPKSLEGVAPAKASSLTHPQTPVVEAVGPHQTLWT